MQIAVPAETNPGELRVSITPDSVARLVKAGHAVRVQRGAGTRAGFPDTAYESAGATLADGAGVYEGVHLVCRVQPPSGEEIVAMPRGVGLLSLLQPGRNSALLDALAKHGITALALELVPRITRAQSMDVLSSQSTVAGYKAVLIGASALPKFLPMLTTAAGNVSPAKVFVIGAGVAGLQAIATARRLGGVVSAFDVRPAAREQVLSLGATFVATDLVVTTAQIPGRAAPKLITGDMVESMRPGSVIVDLAAESGGNCDLTLAGETVQSGTVTIIGPVNVPATVPFHASQMFGKNILALVTQLSAKDGALTLDADTEITGAMTVVRDGAVVTRT